MIEASASDKLADALPIKCNPRLARQNKYRPHPPDLGATLLRDTAFVAVSLFDIPGPVRPHRQYSLPGPMWLRCAFGKFCPSAFAHQTCRGTPYPLLQRSTATGRPTWSHPGYRNGKLSTISYLLHME
jgi:hypothetical protein